MPRYKTKVINGKVYNWKSQSYRTTMEDEEKVAHNYQLDGYDTYIEKVKAKINNEPEDLYILWVHKKDKIEEY